ncbi:RlmE family RNA methyltransferase [bacterium]|nr:RlmE family RNA methyltransferase [bacterium]
MTFNRKDRFFHKAKADGYKARSAYKLEEIQKKYNVIPKKSFVVDLGASPGSWSQLSMKLVGKEGYVVGLDLKPVDIKSPNGKFYVMDIFELDPAIFEGRVVDVLISDMAPNTTGVRSVDQARSEELCLEVLKVSDKYLKSGGNLVMKLFEGGDAEVVAKEVKNRFKVFKRFKPEAVRKGSFETYLIGIGKK